MRRAGRRAGLIGLLVLAGVVTRVPGSGKSPRTFLLEGVVRLPSGPLPPKARARVLIDAAGSPFLNRTWTRSGGRFRFRNLQAGTYTLQAESAGLGWTRVSLDVSATFADERNRVRVDLTLQPLPSVSQTVSTAQLAVSRKSRKAYQRALRKLARGRLTEATELMRKAIQDSPRFSVALNHLGTIYYEQGDYSLARSFFEKALKADPDSYPPLVNLGGALLSLRLWELALPVNHLASSRHPEDPLAHSQLGLSYMETGQDRLAIQQLEQARRIDPRHFSNPQLPLARLYWRRGDRARALRMLEEFLSLHPDGLRAEEVRSRLRLLRQAPAPGTPGSKIPSPSGFSQDPLAAWR